MHGRHFTVMALGLLLLGGTNIETRPTRKGASPGSYMPGIHQANVSAKHLASVCASRKIKNVTDLGIHDWKPKPGPGRIARNIAYLRELAACAPALASISVSGPYTGYDCKGVRRDLKNFNRHYGRTMRALFPHAAVFYSTTNSRRCFPPNPPPRYILPSVHAYHYASELRHGRCPAKLSRTTVLVLRLIRLDSDPLKWTPAEKRVHRARIARMLPRLSLLAKCPRLRLIRMAIPAGLYSSARESDYGSDRRAFRKIHGARIAKLLPRQVIMLTTSIL